MHRSTSCCHGLFSTLTNHGGQIPPNLLTLFAHIMCRTTEEGSARESTASHSWDEVLQPAAGGGKKNSHPFPMNAQDWCKAEVFSDHLQSLIAAYHTQFTATDSVGGRRAAVQNGNCAASATSGGGGGTTASSASHATYANGKAKGKGRPAQQHPQSQPQPAASHARSSNADSSNGTVTPAPSDVAMPRQHCPRVTPREPSRSSAEPSAPTKVVGRVAASRRVNGVAEGAVASLAVSRAGPGAFETPSHAHHDMASHRDQRVGGGVGAGNSADQTRSREHSPSRYPARLRSRRFPQLGGGGETPELPPLREMDTGHGGEDVDGDNDPPNGIRRLSPRTAHSSAEQHYPNGWIGGAGDGLSPRSDHGVEDEERDGHGMRSSDIPKPPRGLTNGGAQLVTSAGAVTPQPSALNTASPPPVNFGGTRPIMGSSGVSAGGSNAKPKAAPRPRQVLQSGGGGGRSGSRTPVPRSSVGGRNYTDNHVKQLILIEAAVVASATQQDHATYNLPRQGRTLTLTNVFKFVALRGAGVMYSLANAKQVEAHTGRHSNFFDGKIDARIVAIIRKDIGDEAITKSRKFSKILLSLIAEGKQLATYCINNLRHVVVHASFWSSLEIRTVSRLSRGPTLSPLTRVYPAALALATHPINKQDARAQIAIGTTTLSPRRTSPECS